MRLNKKLIIVSMASVVLAFGASPSFGEDEDNNWDVDFGNSGFAISTPGDELSLEFGGRIHLDAVSIDQGVTPFQDEADIRRLRFDVSGTVYRDWRLKVDADVGGGQHQAGSITVGIQRRAHHHTS